MPYCSPEHVRIALDYMASDLHSGLTYMLAMLRAGVTASADPTKAIEYGGAEDKALLVQYMSPTGGPNDAPYYMAFGPKLGRSRWRDAKYPTSSLQKQRSERTDVYAQLPEGSGKWTFDPEFVKNILKKPDRFIGAVPIDVACLVCWFYRQEPLEDLESGVEKFVAEFKLEQGGLIGSLFKTDVDTALQAVPMSAEPISAVAVLEMLEVDHRKTSGKRKAPEAPEPEVTLQEEEPAPAEWKIELQRLYETMGLIGMEEAAIRTIAALRSGRHVIFSGPPGTGKTTLAEGIMRAAGFKSYTVSATDQWTTFETIGGYFPKPKKDEPADKLDFLPGAMIASIENGQCLVVDEINRADIDKAFGELFTLLAGKLGTVVTLPYYRRSTDGSFRQVQVRLGTGATVDEANDVIILQSWWRMIGTMNDADKASLKRLSSAFIRRFVFVPIGLPKMEDYERLIRDQGAKHAGHAGMMLVTDVLVSLFASQNTGFASIGQPLGPSFPLSMLEQAASEWVVDEKRTAEAVLTSVLEGLVEGQFQGRIDLHVRLLGLLTPLVGPHAAEFERRLAVWTGADLR